MIEHNFSIQLASQRLGIPATYHFRCPIHLGGVSSFDNFIITFVLQKIIPFFDKKQNKNNPFTLWERHDRLMLPCCSFYPNAISRADFFTIFKP